VQPYPVGSSRPSGFGTAGSLFLNVTQTLLSNLYLVTQQARNSSASEKEQAIMVVTQKERQGVEEKVIERTVRIKSKKH
jgi:hypothetical protein